MMNDTHLGNWRQSPYSRWAFQNVRELIPTARIAASEHPAALPVNLSDDLDSLSFTDAGVDNLDQWLAQSDTDCLLMLHKGKKVWQWQASHFDEDKPHIVFSISKSITAMLTGILVGDKLIDTEKPVSYYLPDTRGSAYEDGTVQQVLDMTVALAFEEDYLNPSGDYFRYRNVTGWNPVDQINDAATLEPFIYSLKKADYEHGYTFEYKSPNSDLLGLLLERVSGMRYADLLSKLIWQPMGALSDGYVTVDRALLARGAGGICVTGEDLARFGQLMLNRGAAGTKTIIPEWWIEDTLTRGDRHTWARGSFSDLLPGGSYRNKWYCTNNQGQCFMALGIHGQWLFINPSTETVIVKLSSQPAPLDNDLDAQILKVLQELSEISL